MRTETWVINTIKNTMWTETVRGENNQKFGKWIHLSGPELLTKCLRRTLIEIPRRTENVRYWGVLTGKKRRYINIVLRSRSCDVSDSLVLNLRPRNPLSTQIHTSTPTSGSTTLITDIFFSFCLEREGCVNRDSCSVLSRVVLVPTDVWSFTRKRSSV